MRLVFAGTPEPAVASLGALISSDRHEVVGVITRPDARAGRGRKVAPSPVRELAEQHAIEVATPQRLTDPEFAATFARWAPQCCPVVAYGALIPPELLAVPPHGWVNVHFSLLPSWRGAAPVQAAISAGDDVTGVSTFQIERGLDTGPVFGTTTQSIRPGDTAGSLLERLAIAGAGLLLATIDGIESGELVAVDQPQDGVSLAPKISVAQARIDWTRPSHIVDREIRAMTPDPGAWTTWSGQRIKIGPVGTAAEMTLAPGAVALSKQVVFVGTGSAPVALGQVQPPGKKWMPAADWARGAHLADGTVLA